MMITRRKMMEIAIGSAALAAIAPTNALAQQLTKEEVFFDKEAPVLGNPKGDVTIVEFFDYQCPYCKKNHPVLKDVVAGDGNVRLVMKDWPVFGDVSVFAAQAVLGAARIGKYEPAMEALMKLPGRITQEEVERALSGAGLDMAQIAATVNKNSERIGALLDRNYNQALAFNFAGTPSFVIGKSLYPGALDEAALKEAIAKARKEKS